MGGPEVGCQHWPSDLQLGLVAAYARRVSSCVTLPQLQDWTSQVSEDAEGIVSFSYRTQPDDPPDVQTIQKQMAIVAWQPGPNRVVQVPDLVRAATTLTPHTSTCPGGEHTSDTCPCACSWRVSGVDCAAVVLQCLLKTDQPPHPCLNVGYRNAHSGGGGVAEGGGGAGAGAGAVPAAAAGAEPAATLGPSVRAAGLWAGPAQPGADCHEAASPPAAVVG